MLHCSCGAVSRSLNQKSCSFAVTSLKTRYAAPLWSSRIPMPADAPSDHDVLANQFALHTAQQTSTAKSLAAQFGGDDSDGENKGDDSARDRPQQEEEQLNLRTSYVRPRPPHCSIPASLATTKTKQPMFTDTCLLITQ